MDILRLSVDIQIESQFGIVADAWLSHAEPYQDLAAFDEFRVYSSVVYRK